MARGSELDRELNSNETPSKTELKKQSAQLQQLGEDLLTLRADLLARLDLPRNLLDALDEARRITAHEGRRRQMQYIGKLMRQVDPEPVRTALAEQHAGSAAQTLALHEAERWRDELIGSDDALTRFLAAHAQADAQTLRALIRQARKDAAASTAQAAPRGQAPRHGRAYREIFQIVRQCLGAGDAADEATPAVADEADHD